MRQGETSHHICVASPAHLEHLVCRGEGEKDSVGHITGHIHVYSTLAYGTLSKEYSKRREKEAINAHVKAVQGYIEPAAMA